jgi:hypothetical protein
VAKYGAAGHATDNSVMWFMRFACWLTKATDTHLEYVIFIVFLQQQWLWEHTSLLRLYLFSKTVSLKINK